MESSSWTRLLTPSSNMFPSFNLRYHRNADETANFPATPLSIPSSKRRDSLFDMDVEIRRDETTPSSLQLLNLPADILLLLSEFLIPASRSSLRLTCRALHNTIPVPSKPLHDDICARTAIYRHIDERQDAASGKHRCALCKALYSDAQYVRARVIDPLFHFTNFAVDQSPSMLKKVDQINIPERDRKGVNASAQDFPSTRICAWHINRFIFPPSEALQPNPAFDKLVTAAAAYGTCPGAVEEEVGKNGWASSIEPVCMHCGRLVVCVCSVGGCNTCTCACDSCGVRQVRCWWKLARVGYGPTRDANFKAARRRWLVSRANEMDRFGWEGIVLSAGEMIDWGLVRVGRCGQSGKHASTKGET